MADLEKDIQIMLRYTAELRGIVDSTKATIDQGKATDELTRKLQAAERELRRNEQATAALQVRQEAMARITTAAASSPAFNVAGATGQGNPSLASVEAAMLARIAAANKSAAGPGLLSQLRSGVVNAAEMSGLPGGAAIARFATNPGTIAAGIGAAGVREFVQEEAAASRLEGFGLGGDAAIETVKQLATVLQSDLASATEVYIRAANGQTRALAQVGIQISENATLTERLAEIQRQAAERSAALLEARSKTLGGQWQNLKKDAGDLLQGIGGLINQSGVLQLVMGALAVPVSLLNQLLGGTKTEAGAAATQINTLSSNTAALKTNADEAATKLDSLKTKLEEAGKTAEQQLDVFLKLSQIDLSNIGSALDALTKSGQIDGPTAAAAKEAAAIEVKARELDARQKAVQTETDAQVQIVQQAERERRKAKAFEDEGAALEKRRQQVENDRIRETLIRNKSTPGPADFKELEDIASRRRQLQSDQELFDRNRPDNLKTLAEYDSVIGGGRRRITELTEQSQIIGREREGLGFRRTGLAYDMAEGPNAIASVGNTVGQFFPGLGLGMRMAAGAQAQATIPPDLLKQVADEQPLNALNNFLRQVLGVNSTMTQIIEGQGRSIGDLERRVRIVESQNKNNR